MDFRTTATSQSLSAFAGGLVLLAAPSVLLGFFGIEGAAVALVGRLAGGMMIALGGALWASRGVTDAHLRIQIAGANATCDALMTLTFLVAAAGGETNRFGYGLAVLFGINCLSWILALRR